VGWVTLDDGQHVYIGAGGNVLPRGPGTKAKGRDKGKTQAISGQRKTREAVVKARSQIWEQAKAKEKLLTRTVEKAKTQSTPPSHANPHIATAIDKATAAGIKTEVLDRFKAVHEWGVKVDHVHASYDYKRDVILINAYSHHWTDPEASAAKAPGWFSTTEKTHTIEHEMAHREHRQAIGVEAFAAMAKAKEAPLAADKIAQHVGRYASKLKVELVAEMRVGMLHGKQYSPRLVDYYKSLGGVL